MMGSGSWGFMDVVLRAKEGTNFCDILKSYLLHCLLFSFTGSSLSCLLWRHLPLPCMPATHLLGWPLIRQPSRSNWPVNFGPEPVLYTVLYVICVPSSLIWDSSSMIVVSFWPMEDPQYFLCFVWDNVSCIPRWPVICLWSQGWPWSSAYPIILHS